MKKGLIFVAVAIVGVLVIGQTVAFYTDTAVSGISSFTAGTLNLDMSSGTETDFLVELDNMAPSDSTGKKELVFTNTGTLDLEVNKISVEDFAVDDSHQACTGGSEFPSQLQVHLYKEGDDSSTVLASNLEELQNGKEINSPLSLSEGESGTYLFEVIFNPDAGSEFQGCGLTDVIFQVQATQS
ncbi:MAG: TasA family protein [Patescibacteria group bacterium]